MRQHVESSSAELPVTSEMILDIRWIYALLSYPDTHRYPGLCNSALK
jgi:hypothetical protein